MKPNILWIFLVTAPLVSASSLPSFQATCDANGCGGTWNSGAFNFGGPFPGFDEQIPPDGGGVAGVYPGPPGGCGIGTNGCDFSYMGSDCYYGIILGGGNCDAEIDLSGTAGVPPGTGLSRGDVVSVVTTGVVEGFFCAPCSGPAFQTPPIFDLVARVTYQFTFTDPSTGTFSWTGAQFTSVPEPGTLVFATLGLAGMAVGRRGRRSRS
ncbi:MAG: PEP-CTERM sorting domain-containing protein [Acidobacteriota bacterium]|nr:PEP-CTERM sorting domain-containing protein [Acidobacteriota bacterium]